MSYRLIDANALAMSCKEVNDMPCIYADLPNGLDGGYYDLARAERTCHIVKNSRRCVLSDGRELLDDGCSICNGYVGDGDNYCSNCGAKVVKR